MLRSRQPSEDVARSTSPLLNDLLHIARALDVTVHMVHIDDDVLGYYEPSEARVYVTFGLTPTELRSVVAHELGHVYYGHECGSDRAERQADAFAAELLVDPIHYAHLEREGHSFDEIADHLNVTHDIVHAFHQGLQRIGRVTYGIRHRGRFTAPLARALAQ